MSPLPQVAFNPLTWFLRPDGTFDPSTAPPLPEIYRKIRDAGFDAVHVDVPDGMSTSEYRKLLDETGLAPAPGYFQAPFADADTLAAVREEAKRVAGQHAHLGLTRIFIADQFGAEARVATPAVGAGFDRHRLDRIIENLATVAASMVSEGVVPCLHPHVGTWIETAEETTAVLDRVDRNVLLFGPDTGHLAWAGADPAAFIDQHLDRVGAVHLKDLRRALGRESRAEQRDYQRTVAVHLWTEPGRGDVDYDAVLRVLSRFDGWYVIEVDLADQPTPEETAAVSARWVREHLTSHNGATR
jgi:inosose dehydratase